MTAINSATSTSVYQTTSSSDTDSSAEKSLEGVAELLGLSTDELNMAQENGVTLAQLANAKGVDADDLQAALVKGLKENAPSDVSADTDFESMAASIIDGSAAAEVSQSDSDSDQNWWSTDDSNTSSSPLDQLLAAYGISSGKTLFDYLSDNSSSSDSQSLFDTGDSSSDTSSSDDFMSQLNSLISQYGSKGNSYDSKA